MKNDLSVIYGITTGLIISLLILLMVRWLW